MTSESNPEPIELSVVMPCLNEIETLETCIRKAQTFLEEADVRGEVIVADNGSTDGSKEKAIECGARLVEVPIRGYGAALYHGTKAAKGRYVIMGDSDDSYNFLGLAPFLEKLREGAELVMGNRFKGGIEPGAMPWKNRYIGNPALTTIGRILFCPSIRDFHCGLRGVNREAFDRLDLQTTGMEYASEMVIKASLRNFKIVEVPTTLSPDGRSGAPHLRPWRDGWRHLRFMFLMSPNPLFVYPGLVAILVGLLFGVLLLQGPLSVGVFNFDITSLLYAVVLIVLGVQSVLFGLLSRLLATRRGLLPASRWDTFVSSENTLEMGLVLGLLLSLAGVALGGVGTWYWGVQGFGALNARVILRMAIPSALFICVGFQLLLASLFVGAIKLSVLESDERGV